MIWKWYKTAIIERKQIGCDAFWSGGGGVEGEASFFFQNLKHFDLIERMLAGLEARRTKILSDIEGRRVDLAWQFRQASNNIIEGGFGAFTDSRANAA
jgi:hypothetical protein